MTIIKGEQRMSFKGGMQMNRRLAVFVGVAVVLLGVAVFTQATIAPAPAQGVPVKETGKITDTLVSSYKAQGLQGVQSIQYWHYVMSPGARLEGDIPVSDGFITLCVAKKGILTATLPDGKVLKHKAGELWVLPSGTMMKSMVADSKQGFESYYWRINLGK